MKNIYSFLLLILPIAIATNAAAQIPNYLPKTGLTAWYPFNSNAKDESGSGNDLTVDSAILTKDRFGKSNAAFSFDGVKSCLHREAINNTDFTFSVWVNMNSFPATNWANAEFVSNGYGNSNGYGIKYGVNKQGMNCVEVIVYGSEDNATVSTFVPDTNTWYHYICTKSDDNYNLYINGTLSSSGSFVSFPVKGFFVVGAVRGSINDTAFSNFFNGQIDDIGFWNRSLTESEVKNLYNNSVLGVEESSTTNFYSIFPNPTQNQITIQIPNDIKATRYIVTNCLGNSLLTGELSNGKSTIDVSNLSDGLYLIQIGVGIKHTFTLVKH